MAQKINSSQANLIPGTILAVAENSAALSWNGTTKTRWTGGTWKQNGIMANTAAPWTLKIVVPTGHTYQVKISHLCSTVNSPNTNWGQTGIALYSDDSGGTPITHVTSSINANGDNFHPQTSECLQELTAGTWYYSAYVRTALTSSNNVWHGGGDYTSATDGSFAFGRSVVLTATLIQDITL